MRKIKSLDEIAFDLDDITAVSTTQVLSPVLCSFRSSKKASGVHIFALVSVSLNKLHIEFKYNRVTVVVRFIAPCGGEIKRCDLKYIVKPTYV